jgi:hypothetical protein
MKDPTTMLFKLNPSNTFCQVINNVFGDGKKIVVVQFSNVILVFFLKLTFLSVDSVGLFLVNIPLRVLLKPFRQFCAVRSATAAILPAGAALYKLILR